MRHGVCILAVALAAAVFSSATAAATAILGPPMTSPEHAQLWARSHGATPAFLELAWHYWRMAPTCRVRPEVAYAQAAKETRFGRFGGVLDPSFNNPAGMKRPAGGPNHLPGAHYRFRDWFDGAWAHLDHLALYAGAPGFPRTRTTDPRHFSSLYGRARTVEALGGKWAPSPSYGTSLAALVNELVRA